MGSEELSAQLSSMASSMEDMGRRVTDLAESRVGTRDDWVAQELFEVERSVTEAVRRLSGLGRELRRP